MDQVSFNIRINHLFVYRCDFGSQFLMKPTFFNLVFVESIFDTSRSKCINYLNDLKHYDKTLLASLINFCVYNGYKKKKLHTKMLNVSIHGLPKIGCERAKEQW